MNNSIVDNVGHTPNNPPKLEPLGVAIPGETAFSIMFVSVGMSCFIWQSMTAGWMFYKARKPVIGIVFFQAVLGVVVTFVTLLTSLIEIDCTFVSDCIIPIPVYCNLLPVHVATFVFCYWCEYRRHLITACIALESLFGK